MQFKETLIAAILIIVVLLVLLIFGDKLPDPLNKWDGILVIICFVLLALVVLFFIIQKVLAVKSAMAIEKKLKAQASDQISGARPDKQPELQALHGQLNEALAALKSSKMGKGALYSLPWYMIIGPPGSGKTTALLESGLNFPYTSQGRGVKGVGGTRNCDWWFTDQGIMLDTAGRYTTEMEDRDEWIGFLDMLKKCRKEKPINGVIVAISISDLINATDEEMEAHSKNIRDRIDELARQLEMVFPVYLIFTKCDLLNGFTDFFEDFTKEDREQIWGMTLPYKQQGDTDFGSLFTEECKKFYESLRNQRVTALSIDRKSDKKRNIYSFPLQFALAHKQLGDFVGMLFRTNPFQESPILRGVFLTSGTQEGFPIDQVVGAMSEAFGLAGESGGLMGGEVEKKSYFINHLFTKLIFPDQKLAQISSKVARRKRFVRWGLGLGSVAALALFVVFLVTSFIGNTALLYTTASAAEDVKENKGADLQLRLEAIESLRKDLDKLERYEESEPFLLMPLYQGDEILQPTRDLYNHHLKTLFLDRLKILVHNELEKRSSLKNSKDSAEYFEDLYELNYAYQVLGGEFLPVDPKNPNLVRNVLERNKFNYYNTKKNSKAGKLSLWLEALGSKKKLTDDERRFANDQLGFYISQLEASLAPDADEEDRERMIRLGAPDKNLVAKVNSILEQNFWIEEKYINIKKFAFDNNQPKALTLSDMAGEVGARYLAPRLNAADRLAGQEPGTIPGIFKQTGYDGYVERSIKEVSHELVTRLALMGFTGKTEEDIQSQLKERYKADLKLYWNTFLKSIHLKPFPDIKKARDFLRLLVSTESPFLQLFNNTWKYRVVTIDGTKYNVVKTESDVEDDVQRWWEKTNSGYKPISSWLGNFLAEHEGSFQKLINKVDPPLDTLIVTFRTAKQKLDDSDIYAYDALKGIVQNMLREPIAESLNLLSRMATEQMNELWKKEVYTPFTKQMKNKYPFARERGNKDVEWSDFAHTFGWKGEKADAASFFRIAYYINILDGPSINERDLLKKSAKFEEALEKAEAFLKLFPQKKNDGTEKLSVKFQLKFYNTAAKTITFTLGTDTYAGKALPRTPWMIWTQGQDVKLTAHPSQAGQTLKEFYPGGGGNQAGSPWALFRFMDSGNFQAKTATNFELLWDLTPQAKLKITLLAEHNRNCFEKRFFNFDCPEIVVE